MKTLLFTSDKSIYKYKITTKNKYACNKVWHCNNKTDKIVDSILEDIKQEITECLLNECLPIEKYESKRHKQLSKVTESCLIWEKQ